MEFEYCEIAFGNNIHHWTELNTEGNFDDDKKIYYFDRKSSMCQKNVIDLTCGIFICVLLPRKYTISMQI